MTPTSARCPSAPVVITNWRMQRRPAGRGLGIRREEPAASVSNNTTAAVDIDLSAGKLGLPVSGS